jgi:hypothetical protein
MPKAISRDGKDVDENKTPFPRSRWINGPACSGFRGRLLFAGDFQQRGSIAPRPSPSAAVASRCPRRRRTWRFKKLPGTQPHERADLGQPDTLGYSAMRRAPNG